MAVQGSVMASSGCSCIRQPHASLAAWVCAAVYRLEGRCDASGKTLQEMQRSVNNARMLCLSGFRYVLLIRCTQLVTPRGDGATPYARKHGATLNAHLHRQLHADGRAARARLQGRPDAGAAQRRRPDGGAGW